MVRVETLLKINYKFITICFYLIKLLSLGVAIQAASLNLQIMAIFS